MQKLHRLRVLRVLRRARGRIREGDPRRYRLNDPLIVDVCGWFPEAAWLGLVLLDPWALRRVDGTCRIQCFSLPLVTLASCLE